jgi:hypothetical protein
MRHWPLLLLASLVLAGVWGGTYAIGHRPFPPETSPEGAYARIALSVEERRTKDIFPYLETEAQWAAYTIRDARKKACDRVRASYVSGERERLLHEWGEEAAAPDGADLFAIVARKQGWMARLERDLSGAASVDVEGERATVVTARGTRYPFRRRENGIWGLTVFTAELEAQADRASRDLEVVQRAADDYDRAAGR